MKINLSIFLVLLVVVLLVGCSQQAEEKTIEKKTIVISGSGSCSGILKLVQEPFENKHPDIKIGFLPSTSTGDGVIGVANGILDISAAARKMKESEKSAYPDLTEAIFVKDAMVLAVNENVEVTDLTSEQIKKIHSGEITNWKEVGGQDGEIVVLDREESESSKILLREHIFGPDLKITDNAILMHSASSMDQGIQDTPNSIGQTSFGMIKVKNLKIKPIGVDGITPSVATVKDESYKMVRDYGVILNWKEATAETKLFVDFLFSEEAKQILENYNFVTLTWETS